MKTQLLLCSSLVVAIALGGCGNKAGSAAQCGDAVNKGVDSMMAASKKRMESMNVPPELKAKLDDAGVKLKEVITKRCVEDKWAKDVIDCYGAAATREDLRNCRSKLPAEQAQKLQAEEMAVMSSMMGGMRPGMMGGMHGMGGSGMGGSGMTPGSGMAGSAMSPPAGSASTPPPAGSAGSAH